MPKPCRTLSAALLATTLTAAFALAACTDESPTKPGSSGTGGEAADPGTAPGAAGGTLDDITNQPGTLPDAPRQVSNPAARGAVEETQPLDNLSEDAIASMEAGVLMAQMVRTVGELLDGVEGATTAEQARDAARAIEVHLPKLTMLRRASQEVGQPTMEEQVALEPKVMALTERLTRLAVSPSDDPALAALMAQSVQKLQAITLTAVQPGGGENSERR